MRAAIVGLGNWGTAIGNHLCHRGVDVLGWSVEDAVVSGINSRHENPRYLSQVELHDRFRATLDLADVLDRELVVLVLPSHVLGAVVPRMKLRPDAILMSATKGLETTTELTPLQYWKRFGSPCRGAVVFSGPTFAIDIVHRRPSGIVAASENEPVAREVADTFSCDWMRVYVSTDPLGVELGGIVKNVIALAAGVSDGLRLGDSARAGLITRGLAEMMRLAAAMGANVRTLSGLSGLGDLIMTASCDTSRNRTVGLRLGRGETLEDIVSSLGSVAEAVETTPHVLGLARKHQVEMPITEAVAALLKGDLNPQQMLKTLMSRPICREVD